ncbi:unnamed protein product [Phyllotreta striolata]|uniref:TGF-beta family profile domain-containing protein n=1 Tax=Phyllotreta striolata TaxID=444603 RepID=A0A9N9TM08_PHYSR|nr:unnamed protein product [Phyllotreta striolata]
MDFQVEMLVEVLDRKIEKQSTNDESTITSISTGGPVFVTDVKSSESAEKNVSTSFMRKRKKIHVPKFMLELYEKNKVASGRDENIDNKRPDIVKSLIPTHAEPFYGNEAYEVDRSIERNHLLVFSIPASDVDERFVSAELKILTILDFDAKTGDNFDARRILKMSLYDDSAEELLDFREIRVRHFNNSWITFDVTSPVNNILQKKNQHLLKLRLKVSAFHPKLTDSLKLSLMPVEDEDYEHDYPILILTYTSNEVRRMKQDDMGSVEKSKNGIKRKRRSIEEDYEEETNRIWDDDGNYARKSVQYKKWRRLKNSCRKRPLYVDFAEIKYDLWIVQPTGYEAYQCVGRCFYPVAEHLNPTKHAIVQALLHSVAPSKAGRTCCVPTALESISILYIDVNGVLTYRYSYKDMVVAECGCR